MLEVSGQSLLTDQIRISGQVAGQPPVLLSSISLQAAGIPEINLIADIAHSSAPVTVKVNIVGGALVITWDTANPGQVLQGADDLADPWTDIPDANTSPYIVPTTGPKKFIRVKTTILTVP